MRAAAVLVVLGITVVNVWWAAGGMVLVVGGILLGVQTATKDEKTEVRCPRDSGWCDGFICRARGIDCPNAEEQA